MYFKGMTSFSGLHHLPPMSNFMKGEWKVIQSKKLVYMKLKLVYMSLFVILFCNPLPLGEWHFFWMAP